jgi:hypothetical protein
MPPGVWAEDMGPAEIEPLLADLGTLGLRLYLALPAARVGDPEIARLTRQAADSGVETRAWILLADADGYWIGKHNARLGKEAVLALIRWQDMPGGPCFRGLSIDLEPSLLRTIELRQLVRTHPWRAPGWLRRNLGPRDLDRARCELDQALRQARASGFHLHAVSYPMVLDQSSASTALEDALDLVVTGLDWDEISVMVYETVFAQFLGRWLGPSLIHAYAESAVRRWGERAGLDLGVVGDRGVAIDPGRRYPAPEILHADVAAALAAGIPVSRIRVYGLAGIAPELGRWLNFDKIVPKKPSWSPGVASLRMLVRLADRGLSIVGPVG